MSPFTEFRLWTREGPPQERVIAGVAAALAVALIGWVLLPTGGNSGGSGTQLSSGSGAGGTAALGAGSTSAGTGGGGGSGGATSGRSGATGSTGSGGAGVTQTGGGGGTSSGAAGSAPSSAGTSGSSAGTTSSSGSSGAGTTANKQCDTRASDVGVSASQIKIGYVNYDLGNAGPIIGLPTPQQDQKQFQALVNYYNSLGGIHCRKIVVNYYDDTLTAQTEHSACLQAQQDQIFAMIFDLFTAQERTCLPAAKVPQFAISPPPLSLVKQFYPYELTHREDMTRLVRDYVFGSQHYGWFKGMTKLGVLDQSCYPELSTELYADLAKVGIPKSSMSVYNYGCPAEANTPDEDTQAAVQFKSAGVSHVMSVSYGADIGFGKAAGQQHYKPKYSIMDDNTWSLIQDSNPPVDSNLDGAFGITKIDDGAEHVANYPYTPATQQCMAISKTAGVASPVQTGVTAIYGSACDAMRLFFLSANASSTLTRAGLASALATLGNVDLSYPAGPSNFTDPSNPTGAQFYRAGVYHSSCTCFQFVDGKFNPQFQP